MADAQKPVRDDVAELRDRIRLLEARMTRIEQGQELALEPGPLTQEQSTITAPADSELSASTVFTHVAMLSFVLMGALILRVLTEQGVLGAWFGTLLGFTYAGHLIVLSFLPGRLGSLARATSLFQCCGVGLGYSIALESALRAHTFDRLTGMAFIAGFVVLALLVAVAHRKLFLALVSITGAAFALTALGLKAEGLTVQLALLVALGGAAATLSWRSGWGILRPLVFSLLLVLLSAGFVIAHRASLDCGPLLTSAIAFWVVVALHHLLAFRRVTGFAWIWFPAATLWLGALAGFEHCMWLAYAAASVSTLTIVALALTARMLPTTTAAAAGLAVTAAVSGAIGWSMLDASGILCAIAGIGLGMAAAKHYPSWAAGTAVFLLSTGAIRGLLHVIDPAAPVHSLLAATFLAALLILHYLHTERPEGDDARPGLPRLLAPVVLVASLSVLFVILRTSAHRLFKDPALFQLSQTGILILTAVLLTFWGQAGRRQSVKYVGLACMVVALAKVGLRDLSQLRGVLLISAVLMLGLSSVAVSWIMRRRS